MRIINNVEVTVSGGDLCDAEVSLHLSNMQAKQKFKIIKADFKIDGEYLDVTTTFEYVPFDRIRRITGYLTGTTDRWCDSKQAELRDRKKHI